MTTRLLRADMATEDAWKALQQVNEWIKVADAKAAATTTGAGVLGGLLLRGFPPPASWPEDPWRAGVAVTSLALVGTSALLALHAFVPRLRAARGRGPSIYFGHIADRYPSSRTFRKAIRGTLNQEGRLQKLIIEQVWENSRIAERKLRTVRWAIHLLSCALPSSALTALLI